MKCEHKEKAPSRDGYECRKCGLTWRLVLEERKKTKPPLGIEPEWLWKEKRFHALIQAMSRRLDANDLSFPPEWVDELWELHRGMRARRGELV